MTNTPTGRGLSAIATPVDTFAIVALDQRNTLKRMYAAAGREGVSEQELIDFKTDVIESLAGTASGMLLDPTYGMPALHNADPGTRPPGVLVAAEPADRGKYGDEPRTRREPANDALWAQSLGGDAVKFLVQFRPDRLARPGEPDIAAEVIEVVREVVEDCRAAGIPSVIENLIYPLQDEDPPDAAQRADLVVEAASALSGLGPDLLKLEYPGDAAACRRLSESITVPWAVLSAGVSFDEFTHVLKVSCDEGGASGFIAGRAIWKESLEMDRSTRRKYLGDHGRRMLEDCLEAMEGRARPFTEFAGQP